MTALVFSTNAYEYLADELCAVTGFQRGDLERKHFPDGERYLRIKSKVYGKNIIIVGGTSDDPGTLELYDLASGLVAEGADNLSLLVPYFGYSTQERAVQSGEVVTAKSRATLLSAIPKARLSTEVVLLDLHTPGIAQYFDPNIHSVHLSAHDLHLRLFQQLKAKGASVIGCTDAGRAKWVQELANDAALPAAFVYKSRTADGKTTVTGINADVSGKHLILYDDMVRSGGSLINAAKAYLSAGASSITAVVTHAVLPGDALDKVQKSGCFTQLHCTNSHPRSVGLLSNGFVTVHSVAELFVDHLKKR